MRRQYAYRAPIGALCVPTGPHRAPFAQELYAEGMYDTFAQSSWSCIMPLNWKYERAGVLLLACPIVCAFDCACMHSLCKRSISITVCLMKFNLRSLMKHNMRKHHESEGEGWHTAFGADPGGQNYVKPHGDPPRFVPGFLDKTDFPRLLTPWARYPQDPSTVPTRSRPWTLPGSPWMYRCWSPVPIYPLGLDKTNFPRIPENILYLVAGVIKSV